MRTADAVQQIDGIFRIAVHVDENNVEVVAQHPRRIIRVGRIRSKFLNLAVLTFAQSRHRCAAKLLVRADHSNGQEACAQGIWNLSPGRHE
jgi:hypothetical protein